MRRQKTQRFQKQIVIPSLLVLTLAAALLSLGGCLSRTPASVPHSGCGTKQSNGSPTANTCLRRLLVFSKTAAYRHPSIKDGKIAIQKLAAAHNFAVDFTEDSTTFTAANLAHYSAVIFLLTTGTILDNSQKAAFEGYIRSGGGYVGIHSASDTEYDWLWYDGLVGAHNNIARKHSRITRATIHVEDRTHPSTTVLPALWIRTDEWYNFASNPRGRVHVLMTIDEKTYMGGTMGADHPIAWYHEYDGGRAWYTALGHTSESYYEPLFLAHLWGGISYAAGPGLRSTAARPLSQSSLLWQTIVPLSAVDKVRSALMV